jgi:serine palmitoyltransferase
LGENGGGVCDFYGIDPAEVDILMGTFTKSFGAAGKNIACVSLFFKYLIYLFCLGGYIAGDKAIIDHLRLRNHAYNYAESISVPVIQQVITSMKIIW